MPVNNPLKTLMLLFLVAISFNARSNNLSIQDHPRYGPNPIYLFFEGYILDVIGYLPEGKSESFQNLNLQQVFKTTASEWREVTKEVLNLSETVDIAILDLWFRNREHFRTDTGEYDPQWFSEIFVDKYLEEGSKVDVWPEGELQAARERIRVAQLQE